MGFHESPLQQQSLQLPGRGGRAHFVAACAELHDRLGPADDLPVGLQLHALPGPDHFWARALRPEEDREGLLEEAEQPVHLVQHVAVDDGGGEVREDDGLPDDDDGVEVAEPGEARQELHPEELWETDGREPLEGRDVLLEDRVGVLGVVEAEGQVLVPAKLPEARELPQDVEDGLRVPDAPESQGPEERQAGEGRLGERELRSGVEVELEVLELREALEEPEEAEARCWLWTRGELKAKGPEGI